MKTLSKKSVVMLGAIFTIIAVTLLTDNGELRQMAICATGEGVAYIPAERGKFTQKFYGFDYSGTTQDLIDIKVSAFGSYEPKVLHAIETLTLLVDDKPVFLDVGANTGTHTMFASRFASQVISIEPWPTMIQRLEAHIKTNNILNVEIHPVGYASKKGTMPFNVPPDFNRGWGSFSSSFAGLYNAKDVIDLPLVRGDDDLAGVAKISAIKMDIEGYEKPALEGLKKTLEKNRPLVFFELNVVGVDAFKTVDEVRAVFPEKYKFYYIVPALEMTWNLNGHLLLCDDVASDFELLPLKLHESNFGRNTIAIPSEHLERLSKFLPQ